MFSERNLAAVSKCIFLILQECIGFFFFKNKFRRSQLSPAPGHWQTYFVISGSLIFSTVKLIIVIYMKQNSNSQNLSEIRLKKELLKRKRRSRRNEVKESFHCQCGKTYLSFSALYLHAKIKHQLKLTTQEKSDICQVSKSCGFAQYTYSIFQANKKETSESLQHEGGEKKVTSSTGNSSKQSHENPAENQTYPSCFNEYLDKSASVWEKNILKQFLKYAFLKKNQTKKQVKEEIYELPYLFNPFVLEYLPENHRFTQNSKKGRKVCSILQNFYIWMKESQMTDLYVFPNSDS